MKTQNSQHQISDLLQQALFTCIFFLVFSSCNKEDDLILVQNDEFEVIEELKDFLQSTGFNRDEILYRDEDSLFIIENDILISRREVENYIEREKGNSNARTEHRRGTYLITNGGTIYVVMSAQLTPFEWRDAVTGAVNEWNTARENLGAWDLPRMVITSLARPNRHNLRILSDFEAGASWIARAYLPSSNGRVGESITINTFYNDSNLSEQEQLFTMVHEIGHTVGFHHTNGTEGSYIPGTPTSDPNSVMNSFVLPYNGFTNGDLTAIDILYGN